MKVDLVSSQTRAAGDSTIAPPAEDAVYRAKVQQAAEQFESFFISQMLRQMRSATKEIAGEDSIYGKNTNADMLDYADTSVADVLSRQRAFGIADVIVRQLLPNNNKA
ncbi:rod-binding protein [Steroidobacter agaridevorans]|uniref:Rod-binding protein n=1 Tax=Steroidobacter agaridevorans TaxID=2695856 RepID=A0A829YM42_9GAMM|nr:rod-binding protein [Steroidobacter agaridevorans]GFE84375.1 rod-binding protein [Steroidobacter agaridevorans]